MFDIQRVHLSLPAADSAPRPSAESFRTLAKRFVKLCQVFIVQ